MTEKYWIAYAKATIKSIEIVAKRCKDDWNRKAILHCCNEARKEYEEKFPDKVW